uniref:Uncharacterized protein n=1 Tax=Arundo donax TaxID=35708 RepID=A0A0A9BEK7_ARUDO
MPGIQLSSHTLIEVPGPTLLINPFFSTSLPCKIAFQVSELLFLLVAERKSPWG